MPDLFNCFEGTSLSSVILAKALSNKLNTEVIPFYSVPWHSLIGRPEEEVGDSKYIDMHSFYGESEFKRIISQFGAESDNYKCRHLSKTELQLLSIDMNVEQWLLVDLTGRFFHRGIARKDVLRFIDMLAKFYSDVIERESPERVFDLDTSSILRKILYIVCERNNVDYFSLTHSRLDSLVVLTKTLGGEIGEELHFKKSDLNNDFSKGKVYIETYQKRNEIMNKEERVYESSIRSYTLTSFFYQCYGLFRYVLKSYFDRLKKSVKIKASNGFSKVISPSLIEGFLYSFKMNINKLLRAKLPCSQCNFDLNNNGYFYLPLSYLVEGVSPVFFGGIVSDYQVIDSIRAHIPFDKSVAVKEHRAMISERTNKGVRKISDIPSVYYFGLYTKCKDQINPVLLIKDSCGVICHSGTTGLEAAILGKPLLIFGSPVYNQFIKHTYIPSQSTVRDFFSDPTKFIPNIDNVSEYIAVVLDVGISINYSSLFNGVPCNEDIDKICDLFVSELSTGKMRSSSL